MENPNSRAKQNQALTHSRRPELSTANKDRIMVLLAKLGVRRQAKLSPQDYLILAEDLLPYEARDVENALERIGRTPRREGETAFPDLPTIEEAVRAVRGERRACEAKERERLQELEQEAYRKAHPDEFMSAEEFWGSLEVRELLSKTKTM
jgi:hypothetical protein